MTLIAVTQRTQFISEINETRDALDQRWLEFLTLCDLTPLIIPNHLATAQHLINSFSLQGVLLTGGNDSPERLASETALMEQAIQNKLPILGVCHGMQFIQEYFGVTLTQISGHVVPAMEIVVNENTVEVNSYHERGTTQTSPELIVWGRAYDGVVKAIKHRDLPIVGMMWHPERCSPFQDRDCQLFKKIYSGDAVCIEQLY